ncbi:DUF3078 domain-containing protein [Nitritalea halalkaliphila]|uniref:DUF3078 domain-containing protein n=1 Tax=Nitritalea halalkaliphila TaxID=590849 RepID=UPI0029345DFF|nr:DUF3078 domain-containing protein [Nitritalea halalkaliphila]
MKKSLLFTCMLMLMSGLLAAQDQDSASTQEETPAARDTTYWTSNLSLGFNFNQAAFSGNWAAGGVNTIALGTIVQANANYAKGKLTFDNQFEFIYGVVRNEGEETRKANDRIFLDSKVGLRFSDKWSYFGAFNLITQAADGFDFRGDEPVLISRFFAPAFITGAIGAEYKPNQEFALRLSPFPPA